MSDKQPTSIVHWSHLLKSFFATTFFVVVTCYNWLIKLDDVVNFEVVNQVDKVSRILLLYSKLIRGESVNKLSFCMETDSNSRAFDRDIEDVRLFLSESYNTQELIYDRIQKCYYLSGVIKQNLEMTEYRFLERLLIQSAMLRKDELIGLLSLLASNTTKPNECLRCIDNHVNRYKNLSSVPLLKMHEDLSCMIASRSLIELELYDKSSGRTARRVVPYDIKFENGKMYLIAVCDNNVKRYLLDEIESFVKIKNLTPREWMEVENIISHFRNQHHIWKTKTNE